VFSGASVLAVIPARGGSKGIPRKNLSVVDGQSLIAHVAKLVSGLSWLDRVVLSTEDEQIAAVGRDHELEVVRRPVELATDEALSTDVWRHAWLEAETDVEARYDIGVLLQPTSPLRTGKDITRCLTSLINEEWDAVITVSPTPSHFSPEKTMTLNEAGELSSYLRRGITPIRQQIPQYFSLNGHCYAARRRRIVDEQRIHGPNTGAVIIDRPVVNIDEPLDLEAAEWLIRRSTAETNEASTHQ